MPTTVYSTAEVRWFYEGTVPAKVTEWFSHGERPPEAATPRTDFYLRAVGGDSLGIKLREGKLEIKQRYQQYGVRRFHHEVTGWAEAWHKWRFELAQAAEDLTEAGMSSATWIGVQKERKLRKFHVACSGEIVAVPVMAQVDQGCGIELTQVSVEGNEWWSLGFEAFGEAAAIQSNLLLVAEYVLRSDNPPLLDLQASFGYPRWLEVIQRSAR